MNGIDKVTAVSAGTLGDPHLSNNESTFGLRNKPKSADINSDTNSSGSDDSSTKLSLSSKTAEEIKKQHQLKQEEIKKTDYTLEMTGIPLFHGRLVSVVKYPDGSEEMVDALSGVRLTAQDLQQQFSHSTENVQDALNIEMANIAGTPGETIKSHAGSAE